MTTNIYNAEHVLYTNKIHRRLVISFRFLHTFVAPKHRATVEKFTQACKFQETVQIQDRLPTSEGTPRSKKSDKMACLFALASYLLIGYDMMVRHKEIDEAEKEAFEFHLKRFEEITQNGTSVYQVKGNKGDGYTLVHIDEMRAL